ncbi:MAG: ATP-dependent Clp protease adaptor ClpS [Sulfurospirillum sp.]|nr:ATP-dependent Clp protease adaptor ClpS [Sulfurospirillum sp.]
MPKIEFEQQISGETQVIKPKHFLVFLLNDDYTSMDFVMNVLISIFRKSQSEAYEIMMKVHKEGKALCGVYTFEIAETKVTQVETIARKNSFPLKAIWEEE